MIGIGLLLLSLYRAAQYAYAKVKRGKKASAGPDFNTVNKILMNTTPLMPKQTTDPKETIYGC